MNTAPRDRRRAPAGTPRRRLAMLAWVASVALGLGLTGLAQEDIVLGMSAPFSGPSGRLGVALYQGAQAYFADVNARGGINGRAVRILARDDGYEPVRAIFNTVELVEADRVPLLFGYVGTPTLTRVLPLLKRYEDRGPYMLFPFTGAEPQRQPPYNELVFNLRASYFQETAGLVDHLVAVGRRRIAIFYQADAYGRSGWDGVRAALGRHGLTMATEATYSRGAPYSASMAAQVAAIRAARPDAIIAVGAYAACAAFVRDAVDQGWDVPIANLSFVDSESLLDLLESEHQRTGRDYASRLINSQVVPSYEDQSLPSVREYRTLLTRYHPEPPPVATIATPATPEFSFVSFEGFLNAKLLTEVLRRAEGATDRASIRRAFRSLDSLDIGIDVPLTFGPTRNQGLDEVYYTRVSDGRFVPLTDWQPWAR